ncbi:hypothetical protein [Actinomadura madurae]|nr:hypothetical protein [Actinomadura madurae]
MTRSTSSMTTSAKSRAQARRGLTDPAALASRGLLPVALRRRSRT